MRLPVADVVSHVCPNAAGSADEPAKGRPLFPRHFQGSEALRSVPRCGPVRAMDGRARGPVFD